MLVGDSVLMIVRSRKLQLSCLSVFEMYGAHANKTGAHANKTGSAQCETSVGYVLMGTFNH